MRPQEISKQGQNASNKSKFILIGEDDIDDVDILGEVFDSVDNTFSLVFINSGQQVIKYLEELDGNLPALILLDYNMPILNGGEILKELQKQDKLRGIPKLIWSTSTSEACRKICMEGGASDYFIKPSNMQELSKAVNHMLSFCKA